MRRTCDGTGIVRTKKADESGQFGRLGRASLKRCHSRHFRTGQNGSRNNADAADVVRRADDCERLGQPFHSGFCRAVFDGRGARYAGDGTDVDEHAAVVFHHAGEDRAVEIESAAQIDVDSEIEQFRFPFPEWRGVFEDASRSASGEVDQNVDAAELLFRESGGRADGIEVEDIRSARNDASRKICAFGGKLPDRIAVDVAGQNVSAVGREFPGDQVSHSKSGSGHDDTFFIERFHDEKFSFGII